MEWIKRAKSTYIAVSVIMVILGAVLMLNPGLSMLTLCYLIGGLMVIFGITRLVGYFSKDLFRLAFQFDLALGIFCMLAGIVILVHPNNIMKLLPVIIGLFVTIDGVFKMQTAIDSKRFGLKRWYAILVLAAVTCVFGLLLIIDPFAGGKALMIFFGATMMIDGIQNLCVVLYTVKTVGGIRKDVERERKTIETDNYREV
ncbi:MAG: DUF308 domain-containing protein [Candidatus Faecivivens sp.]|nr:DUF308 domain-containing protein [Oscillospiraceae bacterium]MDY2713142.1 DUF308 domain-containing protein [Candidatus Faecivivens sp.]